MGIALSTWYFDVNGAVARLDVKDGSERWTAPMDLGEALSALPCFGATRFRAAGSIQTPGTVIGAYQTGPDEVIFDVEANGYNDIFEFTWPRPVRVDMTSGAVIEYPGPVGLNMYTEGRRRYRLFDNDAWDVLNTQTGQFIAQHRWDEAIFTSPSGLQALPAGGKAIGMDNGRLYVRTTDSESSFRIFDLDNLTTDGRLYGVDPDRPTPSGLERGWSVAGDPESWRRRRPAPEFSRDMLEAINIAARAAGSDANFLLAVMNAESGLRTTAYHPAGRYGLMQLTADQLSSGGWTGTPEEYLAAGEGQMPAIRSYLQTLGIPPDGDETVLWLCHLLAGEGLAGLLAGQGEAGLDPTSVVAAPEGPRPELWASHGVADLDGDGLLTLDDLNKYVRRLRHSSRFMELKSRVSRLAAVIPDWPTLTEVNEGDDMGIVRPSAAQLGLVVEIVSLQQEPGFDHEQVVSIEPPAGTLHRLVEPVRVTVNFEG